MSGRTLVALRPRDYEANFELVVTDRDKNECRVIQLTDDQVAHLAFQFADAVKERHYYQKRLARHPVGHHTKLPDVLPQPVDGQPPQHQTAAE